MVTPNDSNAQEKAQEQASKVQQMFEKTCNQYFKTLQDIQKDWWDEVNKQLADHKRSQLETTLSQGARSWSQMTCLPSPCATITQQILMNAWNTIKGTERSQEAYATFLTQLKKAFADVKPEDLTPSMLDGIANCMKVVANYAHQVQCQAQIAQTCKS